jgi:hypothetical protein
VTDLAWIDAQTSRRVVRVIPVSRWSIENFVSGALHTKCCSESTVPHDCTPAKNKALLKPEPMVRLDVASSNVRGGFFPNIGSTGSDAGRYQGAIAEKAVPFPSVARRSQLFFLSVRVTARLGQQIASRALPQLIAIRSTDDESARRRFSTTTISIYLAPTW